MINVDIKIIMVMIMINLRIISEDTATLLESSSFLKAVPSLFSSRPDTSSKSNKKNIAIMMMIIIIIVVVLVLGVLPSSWKLISDLTLRPL